MNVHVTRGAEGLDRRSFTVAEVEAMLNAGVLDWDDEFELIDGEIVPMAAQHAPHAQLTARLVRWFGRAPESSYDVLSGATIRFGDRDLLEPDVAVFPRLPKANRSEFVRGDSLLLAVEVSDSTLSKDLGPKSRRYALAGVPELWVLDVNARVTHVHREPAPEGYRSVGKFAFDEPISPARIDAPPLKIAELD